MSSVIDTNRQLWGEALTRVLDLSTATIKRNAELETRLTELELELAVWKQAHGNVLEIAERDKKAHNAQVATLNGQISSLGLLKNQDPLILCVIDGDANIFSPSLLSQGQQGGRQAAQELTKGIAEYLSQEEVQVFGRLSFWVTVFYKKRGLLAVLQNEGICSVEQFEGFMSGFSQASSRFLVVDVGSGKDGADVKIKEYLQSYARLSQTMRVFFAGSHDGTYNSTLADLENAELLGKIVGLHALHLPADEVENFAIAYTHIEGLFMAQPPAYILRRPGSIPLNGLGYGVTTNGGLISPQSETHSSTTPPIVNPVANGTRPIDPTKPLHKQLPPPCNEHYLMTCSKGSNCKYSHDWYLTLEQLDILSRNAKKAPCNYLKNGIDCPYGDRCCWGHVCPSGARCFHLSKGKCWFKGDAMHPPLNVNIQGL